VLKFKNKFSTLRVNEAIQVTKGCKYFLRGQLVAYHGIRHVKLENKLKYQLHGMVSFGSYYFTLVVKKFLLFCGIERFINCVPFLALFVNLLNPTHTFTLYVSITSITPPI
jgi:hypothetical protein